MGRVLLLLLLVPLSGCLDSPPCASVPLMTACDSCGPCGTGHYPDQPVAGIRGILVDPSIVPVAGARVEVVETGFNTTTDDDGAFRLPELPPGTYHLRATHPAYEDTLLQFQAGGERDPPVLKVQLVRRAVAPYTTSLHLSGFVFCSSSTGGVISEECGAGVGVPGLGRVGGHPENRAQVDFHTDGGHLRSIAADLRWEPTLTVGGGVQEGEFHAGLFTEHVCDPVCRYDALIDDKRGPSPLLLRDGDGEQGGERYFHDDRNLTDVDVTPKTRFSVFVWASDEHDGVLLEQPFEVLVTLAYVLPLPDDWMP